MYFILFFFFFLEGFSCFSVTHQPRNFTGNFTGNFSRNHYLTLECGVTDRLETGEYTTIESQNYPADYPNRHSCPWTIITPRDASVYFNCDTFDVKEGDILSVGSIDLSGKVSENNTWGFYVHPLMSDNQLTIKFQTNRKGTAAGFRFVCSV